jgi:hypothetical protein
MMPMKVEEKHDGISEGYYYMPHTALGRLTRWFKSILRGHRKLSGY